MGFLKSKNVPDELPELALSEIKKDLIKNEEQGKNVLSEKQVAVPASHSINESAKVIAPTLAPEKEAAPQKEVVLETIEKKRVEINSEKSFFNQILTDINEEISDLNSLEKWYDKKFVSSNVVGDMKGYWESQKQDIVLKSLGQNFKERINVNIQKLQALETEWQDRYFDLLEKEEEMKEQEKELRKVISEFIELGKRRNNLNNEVPSKN